MYVFGASPVLLGLELRGRPTESRRFGPLLKTHPDEPPQDKRYFSRRTLGRGNPDKTHFTHKASAAPVPVLLP